jgi:hypothetical protein
MDNSPLENGLSLTLSWGSRDARSRRSLPIGTAIRVGLGLALCAACFEAGRWHGGLEAQAERTASRAMTAVRAAKALPAAETRTGATGLAPGQAVGEPADVITPLNVRDPSALVMGPGATAAPFSQTNAPPPTPPSAEPESNEPKNPPARVFPRPHGDLKPDPRF